MGLRDTLKRLMPGHEEKEGDGRPAGDDNAETPPALPQIALPPGDTLPEYAEKVTGKRRPSSDAAPQSPPIEAPAVTGRRRASGASATRRPRPRARSHGAIGSLPKNKAENPTDYLYFGPGLDAAGAAARSGGGGGGAPAGAATRTPETRRRALSSGCAVARTDDSGFLNTGVAGARQQMGYQNLTYGGSLQYDYSGTQAPC